MKHINVLDYFSSLTVSQCYLPEYTIDEKKPASRSVTNSFIPGSIVLRVNCTTLLVCALGSCLLAGGLAGCLNDMHSHAKQKNKSAVLTCVAFE